MHDLSTNLRTFQVILEESLYEKSCVSIPCFRENLRTFRLLLQVFPIAKVSSLVRAYEVSVWLHKNFKFLSHLAFCINLRTVRSLLQSIQFMYKLFVLQTHFSFLNISTNFSIALRIVSTTLRPQCKISTFPLRSW